jgi:hypothetical protein
MRLQYIDSPGRLEEKNYIKSYEGTIIKERTLWIHLDLQDLI